MKQHYHELINHIQKLETLAADAYQLSDLWSSFLFQSPKKYWLDVSDNETVLWNDKKIVKLEIFSFTHAVFLIRVIFSDGRNLALTKKDPEYKLDNLLNKCAHDERLLLDGFYAAFNWDELHVYKKEDHEFYFHIHQKILVLFKMILLELDRNLINTINIIEPSCGFARASFPCLDEAIKNFKAKLHAFDLSEKNIIIAQRECPDRLKEKVNLFSGNTEKLGDLLASFNLPNNVNGKNILISSGGMNESVISGKAIGLFLLQTMYRNNIDIIIAGGKTRCFLNSSYENAGFKVEKLEDFNIPLENAKTKTSQIYVFSKKELKELVVEVEKTLNDKNRLDLSLTPVPLAILQEIKFDIKKKVQVINLSLSYMEPQEVESLLTTLKDFSNLKYVIVDSHINSKIYDLLKKSGKLNVLLLNSQLSMLQGFIRVDFYERVFKKSILDVSEIEDISFANPKSIANLTYSLLGMIEDIGAHPSLSGYEIHLCSKGDYQYSPQLKIYFTPPFLMKIKKHLSHLLIFRENISPVSYVLIENKYGIIRIPGEIPSEIKIRKEVISEFSGIQENLREFANFLNERYPNQSLTDQVLKSIDDTILEINNGQIQINDKKTKIVKNCRTDLLNKYVEIYQDIIEVNNLSIEYSMNEDTSKLELIKSLLIQTKDKILMWMDDCSHSKEAKIEMNKKIMNTVEHVEECILMEKGSCYTINL